MHQRPSRIAIVFALLLLPGLACAAPPDPCSAASSAPGVGFALALKDGRSVFQAGEIIPLTLSFTSAAPKRYWADVRNSDRGGPLGTEDYCVQPEALDPLASFFQTVGIAGGGLFSTQELGATPLTADAELNDWRTLPPGHYRVYAVSHRVWRPPDPGDSSPGPRIPEIVRSNTVDLDVLPPDPAWQNDRLGAAVQTLSGAPSPEDARHAARVLRFLNTQDSTRQLARLFTSPNEQPAGWDLMRGLYASPYPSVAIDSMRDQLAAPDHAIASEFLDVLVNLQLMADPAWSPASVAGKGAAALQDFWQRRQTRQQALAKAETQRVIAALPRKSANARALTLRGLLTAAGSDHAVAAAVRPALIAAWNDLPAETQRQLVQYEWPLIAGPDMLPLLLRMVAGPAPPFRTIPAMARDAALKHIYELDPAAAREPILRDPLDRHAQPSLEVIALLPKEDIPSVLRPALERIGRNEARELDYDLLDRYADATALAAVQPVFEEHVGHWASDAESAMLRYFLRVDPAYGAKQVAASLSARDSTGGFSSLLQSLGDALPKVQPAAIAALDDSDPGVVQDAVLALARWGTPAAEDALWARLRRFHREWAGREDQLRPMPDYQSPASRAAALEHVLALAIAGGVNWICPPDKLAQLAELVSTKAERQQVEYWTKQWQQGPALVQPNWFPEDRWTFNLLQYTALTEDQLLAKLAQFPRGSQLLWQFSPSVPMAVQEAVYDRMRAAAAQSGVTLAQANHQ